MQYQGKYAHLINIRRFSITDVTHYSKYPNQKYELPYHSQHLLLKGEKSYEQNIYLRKR